MEGILLQFCRNGNLELSVKLFMVVFLMYALLEYFTIKVHAFSITHLKQYFYVQKYLFQHPSNILFFENSFNNGCSLFHKNSLQCGR